MKAEKMIREYPKMKKELALLSSQIENYQGLTEDDVIEMMLFRGHDNTERVQTSNISDSTAEIALKYKQVMDRENRQWLHFLLDRYWELRAEIDFLEQSIRLLPDELRELMEKIVFEGRTWDEMESELYVCRSTVGNRRRQAIKLLDEAYAMRYRAESDYICS